MLRRRVQAMLDKSISDARFYENSDLILRMGKLNESVKSLFENVVFASLRQP